MERMHHKKLKATRLPTEVLTLWRSVVPRQGSSCYGKAIHVTTARVGMQLQKFGYAIGCVARVESVTAAIPALLTGAKPAQLGDGAAEGSALSRASAVALRPTSDQSAPEIPLRVFLEDTKQSGTASLCSWPFPGKQATLRVTL